MQPSDTSADTPTGIGNFWKIRGIAPTILLHSDPDEIIDVSQLEVCYQKF
jgi:hypothetical protein